MERNATKLCWKWNLTSRMLCQCKRVNVELSTHLSFIILIKWWLDGEQVGDHQHPPSEPNCELHLQESWSGHLWYQHPSWVLTLLSKRDSCYLPVNLKLVPPPNTPPLHRPPHPHPHLCSSSSIMFSEQSKIVSADARFLWFSCKIVFWMLLWQICGHSL